MNADQLSAVVAALRERMPHAAPEVFDRMLEVQQALATWGQAGRVGALPHSDELQGWGIALPTEAAEPTPVAAAEERLSPGEVTEILQRLRQLSGEEQMAEQAGAVYGTIRAWERGGTVGPLPEQEALAQLGVWPNGTTPVQQPPLSIPVAPEETGATGTATDPDDSLEIPYQDARAMMARGEYYQARSALGELRRQALGRLVGPVETSYIEASNRLQELTRHRVQLAHATQQEHSTDLARQKRDWEEVLKLNPDSTEANEALTRLAQAKADEEIGHKLATLVAEARQASTDDNLPKMNESVGHIRAWRAMGEATPPQLSGDLYQRVVAVEEEVRALRDKMRTRLGQSSTLLASGDYREAYQHGRELLERGVPKIFDVAGMFGQANVEVDTLQFFKAAQERFIPTLRSLAVQRLNEAEGVEAQNPEQAKVLLDDAEGRLTDSILTRADQEEFKRELAKIQEKKSQVERNIAKYNLAKTKVVEAQASGKTRDEALALLVSAKEDYPTYPNLDIYIEQARDAVTGVLATTLEAAIAEAERQMERDEFSTALARLAQARLEAIKEVGTPKPGSELSRQLEELKAQEQKIAAREGSHQRMLALLKEVDEALRRYDGGDKSAITLAHSLLEQAGDREKQHPLYNRRWADLVVRQGTEANWETGLAEYRQQRWEMAEASLRKAAEGKTSHQKEAMQLAERALACRCAQAAAAAEAGANWKEAKQQYQRAVSLLTDEKVGTDNLTLPVLQQCQDGVQRLEPMEQSDQKVQQSLTEAATLHQIASQKVKAATHLGAQVETIEEFARAVTKLEEAAREQSTLASEANTRLQKVRGEWRESYLRAMRAALVSTDETILSKAMALGKALEEASLLFEPQDEKLATDLQLAVLDREYERLQQGVVDWGKIEENRSKRLKIPQGRSAEVEAAFRHAVRERILRGVHELRGEPLKAKDYLTEALRRPDLQADEPLTQKLIELCWELGDWGGAERLTEDLGYRNPAVGEVWRGLTRAARWYHAGSLSQGEAELAIVRERCIGQPDLTLLIGEKEKRFHEKTLEKIRHEAEAAEARNTDDGYIEAAERYARASELSNTDQRITMGLRRVGVKLGSGILQRCAHARNISVGQRPLAHAVQEIEQLHGTLAALDRVMDKLGLEPHLQSDVRIALEDLAPKRQRWRRVWDALEKSDRARDEALRNPHPLNDQGTGGWQLGVALGYAKEAQGAAVGDRDCVSLVQATLELLTTLDEKARQLGESVSGLLQAVREEEFDKVVRLSDEVGKQWQYLSQQEAVWGGLEGLLRHPYPGGRTVERLQEHRRMAMEHKATLEQWERWSEATMKAFSDAQRKAKALTKEPLDELRHAYELKEIAALCRECAKACDRFDEQLNNHPNEEPDSQKAEGARERVPGQLWKGELFGDDGYRAKVVRLEQEVKQALDTLNGPTGSLTRLRRIIDVQIKPFVSNPKKKVPAQNVTHAKMELQKCEEIDPLNSALEEYRSLLKGL